MYAPILLVMGTRPEAIKMIPVYAALKKAELAVLICSTSQHDDLLTSVFTTFGVQPDFDLRVMKPDQDLFHITQAVLDKIKIVLEQVRPCLVLVQGDTTTAMAATLAAFYLHIKVGHIEAGLRTHDLYAPFPEEMNRRFISLIASYHFAPTATAAAQLLAQGISPTTIHHVGNTIVDALHTMQDKIRQKQIAISSSLHEHIALATSKNYTIALLTIHRRESLANGIIRVLETIKQAVHHHKNLLVIYPYHPNPRVYQALQASECISQDRFYITQALAYPDLVYILTACNWVMTDSGGIQEEAVSLGKPTLILRDQTERMEGVWAGLAKLVGTDPERITQEIAVLMNTPMGNYTPQEIYGDGHAADRIAHTILQYL
jgi:UDP-N-acetylglucosamine 2-epimerase (non-hydrolysing)